MRSNNLIYISESLALLAVVVNGIQFLLFSLIGIEYDPEAGTGLVAIVNVSCCLYTIVWVVIKEINGKRPVHHVSWPYLLPLVIILLFFVESAFYNNLSLNSFAGKQFVFFCVFGIPAIFLATFIYRYDRFDIVTRSSDIIMLLCTLALVLNLPNMLSSGAGRASIGGSGGHQEIGYSASFCFLINWVNIITGNTKNRFHIFQRKIWRYLFFLLLPLQALVCFLSGGRGGALLLILGFLISIIVFSRHKMKKTLPWTLLAVSALIFITITFGGSGEGFGRTFNYIGSDGLDFGADDSSLQRLNLRQSSYEIIMDSPIIGYGLWGGLAYANFFAHNIFLDVLISGGVLYLLIFLLIMKRCYRGCVQMFRNDISKSVFLAWILYPCVMLMFSGFYLNSSLFWFTIIYAYLSSKSVRSL
jgi:hypothetical protein